MLNKRKTKIHALVASRVNVGTTVAGHSFVLMIAVLPHWNGMIGGVTSFQWRPHHRAELIVLFAVASEGWQRRICERLQPDASNQYVKEVIAR